MGLQNVTPPDPFRYENQTELKYENRYSLGGHQYAFAYYGSLSNQNFIAYWFNIQPLFVNPYSIDEVLHLQSVPQPKNCPGLCKVKI